MSTFVVKGNSLTKTENLPPQTSPYLDIKVNYSKDLGFPQRVDIIPQLHREYLLRLLWQMHDIH